MHPSDDDLNPPPTGEAIIVSELLASNKKKAHYHTIAYDKHDRPTGEVGHPMELGRMMPAQFSRMMWNIPYFVVFTSSVWLGFHFLFYPYDYANTFRDLSEETYITMLVIAFFFGVGIVVEVCAWLFRKHWPAGKSGDISVDSSPPISSKEGPCDCDAIDAEETDQFSDIDTIVYHIGRPSSEDLLADASRATAPGIFVCGPIGMVQTLRAATGLENSALGLLTRYAVYEESFEL